MMKSTKRKPGVYCITCIPNNKVYIGSSKEIQERLYQHIGDLQNGKHPSKNLSDDFILYGSDRTNFKFEAIEFCSPDILRTRETYWVEIYKSHDKDFGYNIMSPDGSRLREVDNQNQRNIPNRVVDNKVLVIDPTTNTIKTFPNPIGVMDFYNLDYRKVYDVLKYWSPSRITMKASNLTRSTKGLILVYKEFYDETIKYSAYDRSAPRNRKSKPKPPFIPMEDRKLNRKEILMLNLETSEEKLFRSVVDLSDSMAWNKKYVYRVLSGEKKTYKGFAFLYTNDDLLNKAA